MIQINLSDNKGKDNKGSNLLKIIISMFEMKVPFFLESDSKIELNKMKTLPIPDPISPKKEIIHLAPINISEIDDKNTISSKSNN